MVGPQLLGRVLAGRYRLTRELGAGGMGAVYCAIDERLGGEVALEVILGDVDEGGRERFRREARAAAALANPHIVRVHDFQENADEPAFLAMEKIEGISLDALVKRDGRSRRGHHPSGHQAGECPHLAVARRRSRQDRGLRSCRAPREGHRRLRIARAPARRADRRAPTSMRWARRRSAC